MLFGETCCGTRPKPTDSDFCGWMYSIHLNQVLTYMLLFVQLFNMTCYLNLFDMDLFRPSNLTHGNCPIIPIFGPWFSHIFQLCPHYQSGSSTEPGSDASTLGYARAEGKCPVGCNWWSSVEWYTRLLLIIPYYMV